MIGRTLMQQAKPITFGLKTAGWLESIANSRERIVQAKPRILKGTIRWCCKTEGIYFQKVVQDLRKYYPPTSNSLAYAQRSYR
ncbi:MAG: lyase family protein [Bacteroidia bacterium]